VERLPSKHKALSSSPAPQKKKKLSSRLDAFRVKYTLPEWNRRMWGRTAWGQLTAWPRFNPANPRLGISLQTKSHIHCSRVYHNEKQAENPVNPGARNNLITRWKIIQSLNRAWWHECALPCKEVQDSWWNPKKQLPSSAQRTCPEGMMRNFNWASTCRRGTSVKHVPHVKTQCENGCSVSVIVSILISCWNNAFDMLD
jgi:hypothetical protein